MTTQAKFRPRGRRLRVPVVAVVAATTAVTLALPALSRAAAASPADGGLVRLRVAPDPVPAGARDTGDLSGATPIAGDVALAPADPAALERFVAAVSDPSSPLYRHYLAPGQFGPRFGASLATVHATEAWLRAQGFGHVSTASNRLSVHFAASASQAAAAFGVHLRHLRLASGASAFAADASPLVPKSLAGSIVGVLGLSDTARPQPQLVPQARETATPGVAPSPAAGPGTRLLATTPASPSPRVQANVSGPSPCSAAASAATTLHSYTPDELAKAYGLNTLYSDGELGAGVTVAVYELEPYTPSDIASYQSCMGTSAGVSTVTVDGGPTGGQQGEAALDIEQVIGLAPLASVLVYQGPNNNTGGPYDVYNQIATDDKAQVVTTSWGLCEQDAGATLLNSENTLFAQMASQGQSVFAAAGDRGAEDCQPSTALAVDDPASQPHVTGVGGTSLTAIGPPPVETVWNDGTGEAGGGGFSVQWPRPSYQPGPATYRAVPDVSADADPSHGITIYWEATWGSIGGTSAGAPLWAALTALGDQGCTKAIGEVNPKLYPLGSAAFHDITTGNNDTTGTHPTEYAAGPGFDEASGWGTPNAPSIITGLQPSGGCPAVTSVAPASGSGASGNSVTIDGTNLAGATSVLFGGVAASITNDTASSVTVSAPGTCSTGTVDVTVVTANGTSAVVPYDQYSYTSSGCPPVPSGLTALPGPAQVALSWTSDSGSGPNAASGYKLYRSVGGGAFTFLVQLGGASSDSYTDSGLTDGTTYAYEITAYNGTGESAASSAVDATPPGIPATPSGLGASVSAPSAIGLSWTADTPTAQVPVTGYRIYRSSDGGSTYPLLTTVSGAASNSYPDTGLTAGTTYRYEITAYNGNGESAQSAAVSATAWTTPGTPGNLGAVAGNGQVVLGWTADTPTSAAPVTGYRIYRSSDGGSTYPLLATVSGSSSNGYTDNAVTNGTTYSYEVTAYNGVGESSASGPQSATPTAPPSPMVGTAPPGSCTGSGPLDQFTADHAGGRVWNAYDLSSWAGGPAAAGCPSVVDDAGDGLLHVYVRSVANDVVEYVDNAAGGRLWNSYDLTFGGGNTSPVGNSPDAFYDPADGRIHIYVQAVDGDLVEYVNDNVGGHPWNQYDLSFGASGGGPIVGSPSAFYDPADGLIHAYVRDTHGNLVEYDNGHVGGVPWNAWGLSVGASGGGPVTGTPDAFYLRTDGLIHVYVPGPSGDLVEYDNGHVYGVPWNAWDLSYGASGGGTITGTPNAFYDPADGLIHVYVTASNGQLTEYDNGNLNGHPWNAWGLSFGASGGGPVTGSPSALLDAVDGLIHVYARATNGDLVEYVNGNVGGHPWNAWDLTAGSGGPTIACDPAAVVFGSTISVFAAS